MCPIFGAIRSRVSVRISALDPLGDVPSVVAGQTNGSKQKMPVTHATSRVLSATFKGTPKTPPPRIRGFAFKDFIRLARKFHITDEGIWDAAFHPRQTRTLAAGYTCGELQDPE